MDSTSNYEIGMLEEVRRHFVTSDSIGNCSG